MCVCSVDSADQDIVLFVLFSDERMDVLKKFCGVDENPSMQNLACIVLLHLMLQIWADRLR